MKLILRDLEAELVERLADLDDDAHLYVTLQEVPLAPDHIVTAICVTVTVPSPVLGARLMHTDLLNPMEAIGDELITRSAMSIRTALAAQRHDILSKLS